MCIIALAQLSVTALAKLLFAVHVSIGPVAPCCKECAFSPSNSKMSFTLAVRFLILLSMSEYTNGLIFGLFLGGPFCPSSEDELSADSNCLLRFCLTPKIFLLPTFQNFKPVKDNYTIIGSAMQKMKFQETVSTKAQYI